MICCYADELKEGFYPYVEQVGGWAWAQLLSGLLHYTLTCMQTSMCAARTRPWLPHLPCPLLTPRLPAPPPSICLHVPPWLALLPSAGHPDHGAPAQVLLQRGSARLGSTGGQRLGAWMRSWFSGAVFLAMGQACHARPCPALYA